MSLYELQQEMLERVMELNGTEIVLTRTTRTKVRGGGFKTETVELDPQLVEFYPARRHDDKVGEGGESLDTYWVLIAPPNTDIQRGDTFVQYGTLFTVVDIDPMRHFNRVGWLQCVVQAGDYVGKSDGTE